MTNIIYSYTIGVPNVAWSTLSPTTKKWSETWTHDLSTAIPTDPHEAVGFGMNDGSNHGRVPLVLRWCSGKSRR